LRLLERIDEPVVVAEYLRAEIESERFGAGVRDVLARLQVDERLVREPDLADPMANALRKRVLDEHRGAYHGRNLDHLEWHRALFEPDEVLAIRFIAWDWWLEVTGGSRLPADAAAYARAGGSLSTFPTDVPRLIVVRADPASHVMVVEGHSRLEAYALHSELLPAQLEVLLGEGSSIRRWSLY
jgi:hypothetical protein